MMAALDRRLNLRISSETYEAFEALADVVGVSVSGLVRGVLEGSQLEMLQMAEAFRQMKAAAEAQQPSPARVLLGLDLYRKVLASMGAQIGAQDSLFAGWEHEVSVSAEESQAHDPSEAVG
jgi:hypothetical protein